MQLAKVVASMSARQISLTIAGRTDPDLEADLAALATSHVRLVPRRLSDGEYESLVAASDIVVLPFVDMLHSGSIVHALSLNRPVITPATPYASDLAEVVGHAWIRTFDGPLTEALLTSLTYPRDTAPDLSELSAQRNATAALRFYGSLITKRYD